MLDNDPILRVLRGESLKTPPVWFMRQAGRYLPEYRQLRASAPDFVSFCLDPQKASEATLQPIRRFGYDGAILFSDILMIPHALGQGVRFEAGEGPVLDPLPDLALLSGAIKTVTTRLSPVAEAIERIKSAIMGQSTTLIGFCGGPWTVMTYMLNGKKASDRSLIRAYIYQDYPLIETLLDIIIEASAHYLKMQADAGVQVLMIFESWAEGFPDPYFERLVTQPHIKLVERVRALGVDLPVIGFPRGAESRSSDYAKKVPVTAMALGTATPLELGKLIQKTLPIQGALDPVVLRSGGIALEEAINRILEAWGEGPLVFNLGHGIFPDTPIENVTKALEIIRSRGRIA